MYLGSKLDILALIIFAIVIIASSFIIESSEKKNPENSKIVTGIMSFVIIIASIASGYVIVYEILPGPRITEDLILNALDGI
jgi:uncharacterized membrane protein